MELFSFWVVNPAEGQEGKPEPIKLVFFDNGDLNLISLCQDPEYWGAFKLPSGSYSYSGETITVKEEDLDKIQPLVGQTWDEDEFRSSLFSAGLLNDREWDLFYANPIAWKSLKIVVVQFGK